MIEKIFTIPEKISHEAVAKTFHVYLHGAPALGIQNMSLVQSQSNANKWTLGHTNDYWLHFNHDDKSDLVRLVYRYDDAFTENLLNCMIALFEAHFMNSYS